MNVWFSSDWHFGHAAMLEFTNDKGERTRPEFDTVEQMDETMISRHNQLVKPQDKFYCLGDVGFNKPHLESILPRLNGKKRLILGNHDGYDMRFYCRFFDKIIVSWNPIRSLIFTHFPIRIDSGNPKIKANAHGHIHRSTIDDDRYMNLSVEMTDYYPVHYDQIIQSYKQRGIDL